MPSVFVVAAPTVTFAAIVNENWLALNATVCEYVVPVGAGTGVEDGVETVGVAWVLVATPGSAAWLLAVLCVVEPPQAASSSAQPRVVPASSFICIRAPYVEVQAAQNTETAWHAVLSPTSAAEMCLWPTPSPSMYPIEVEPFLRVHDTARPDG